jgi:hypothetical protein
LDRADHHQHGSTRAVWVPEALERALESAGMTTSAALTHAPANHASGAIREVCRSPFRPKPLSASYSSRAPRRQKCPRSPAFQPSWAGRLVRCPQSVESMAAGSWSSESVGRLTQTNSLGQSNQSLQWCRPPIRAVVDNYAKQRRSPGRQAGSTVR